MFLVWYSMARAGGVGVHPLAHLALEKQRESVNYVINNSFSHLTLVDQCAVSTGLRLGGWGKKENKVLDKEINHKLSKETGFQGDSVSLILSILAYCMGVTGAI